MNKYAALKIAVFRSIVGGCFLRFCRMDSWPKADLSLIIVDFPVFLSLEASVEGEIFANVRAGFRRLVLRIIG